ncbi:ribbon-helix-helix domain-containing protein [Bacillus cytotoxicus]|uniref:ribbon-helix-helix domain-containing protein n=1 Tax=Bacillus cytotoxicus TaxID=580165 RepID=UPI0024495293|nr:ribbon-helix-helix domain-containing protein [Bacillus cytotoxicus]MDH2882513.1 ribbon-helix-helix domain-containing protein [Bacillus cytotoxicus]
MKTAGEIIQYLNETHTSIYELSKTLGLGDTTLRQRLIRLGYQLGNDGMWSFSGDQDKEPIKEDVVSGKRRQSMRKDFESKDFTQVDRIVVKPNVHQALMELNLDVEGVRTTISIHPDSLEQLKKFARKTRLKLSDLYSLALFEFLEKYDIQD